MEWTRPFSSIGLNDLASVGGKNASLGEMIQSLSGMGIRVPDGFALTAEAYREFMKANELDEPVREIIESIDRHDVRHLKTWSARIRELILGGRFPFDVARDLRASYRQMCEAAEDPHLPVAVRSSATAEDLPNASFAGQQDSYLYVSGEEELLTSVRKCFASLFNARAISYREDMGFDHFDVALSVGVQRMARSDLGSSGVMFTIDTESGFRDVVMINSIYGLGENIVQGKVSPDEFYVHKPLLAQGKKPLIWKKVGTKSLRLGYDASKHKLVNRSVPEHERRVLSISAEDVLQLAKWGVEIERYYSEQRDTDTPMDIEWAKDGISGELFIVQARPETVHSLREQLSLSVYKLKQKGEIAVEGMAVGEGIAAGPARVISSSKQIGLFKAGEVLVTEITDPDWEPVMKRAAAIVTARGGRTSHAAIVARELGIPAVVGTGDAPARIESGEPVTVSCAEGDSGKVYRGALEFDVESIPLTDVPKTETQVMMNLADPEQALKMAQVPNDGVGLCRMEFVFASWVKVHPLALTRYATLPKNLRDEIDEVTFGYEDKTEYFVDRLSQGVGTIAAAFWPRPVILRFSDFKTNEYENLLGGKQFEPKEENPMIGWRGASRYYHPDFKEGFMLELKAVRRIREEFGLTNLLVMVPFCRTPEEGQRVLDVMKEGGLERGKDGLEVYVMAEIPSNILAAAEFAEIFDGFSIGSNDLTQLTLGVDRDSDRISSLFDERNIAVKRACTMLLETAKKAGKKVGICGQAPSDFPDFAEFLVEQGIDSMSLTPDAIVKTRLAVAEIERASRSRTS